MKFEKGYIYHIYNQGNNRQKIFFNRENYLFFLKKIKTHITPYADIMAWCLMPNHFHLMVLVNEVILSEGFAQSEPPDKKGITTKRKRLSVSQRNNESINSEGIAQSDPLANRTLNQSIGIMLRSYTNAINKQENFTGSLFRRTSKAECISCPDGISPSFYNTEFATKILASNPEFQYSQVCFEYIHQNPVKAGLVKTETDWEFSSARDYAGIRKGTLVNKQIAQEYIKIGLDV